MITEITSRFPSPLRALLKKTPLYKAFWNKSLAELNFQTEWAREFRKPEVREKCREYWHRYRNLPKIMEVTGLDEHSRVLDVGCGISTVLYFIPGERHGMDPLAEDYNRLLPYPKDMKVVKGDSEDMPYEDGFFDVVFCTNVIDHVTDPGRPLREIRRVLKKDGHLVLTIETFDKELGARDMAHPHSFTKDSAIEFVKGDFRIVYSRHQPWVGFKGYARGQAHNTNEIILILKPRKE